MNDVNPTELFPEIDNIYDFPSVHASMIFDKVRTDAFKKAIEEAVKPGDVVMDIGAGTGVLSLFAERAGASRVHVVERSAKAMGWAKRVLADSGCDMDVFHFHMDEPRYLDASMIGEVDVLVSELLGHIGIEEGVVGIMHGSRRFLKPGGVMIPREVAVLAYLVHAPGVYRRCIGRWGPGPDEIQGVDFSVMREAAVDNVYIADLGKSGRMLSNQELIFHRVLGDGGCPSEFSDVFKFLSVDDAGAMAHGVGVYFDSPLIGARGLSSGPRFGSSHWKQGFIPFPEPIEVWPGRTLKLRFSMKFSTNVVTTGPFAISMEVLDDA